MQSAFVPVMKGRAFTKVQGLGNDFVVLDCLDGASVPSEIIIRELCDRRFGIGADGVIAILRSSEADCRMRIFNSDGSEAQMCGNGIRCVAKYLYLKGLVKGSATVETLAGVRRLSFDESCSLITVDMGLPVTEAARVPVVCSDDVMLDRPVECSAGILGVTAVSMGNPHGVVFVDGIDDFLVFEVGPELEKHAIWPQKANIEFAAVRPDGGFDVRVWERGAGETLACGTGACAVAVAAAATGRGSYPFSIHLPGGILLVDRDASGHVLLTGPAEVVFRGVVNF